MNTSRLKKFSQAARRQLIEQVGARLKLVLQTDSSELREQARAIQALQEAISKSSPELVVERVAYTWFNRFCALRFMDLNRYNRIGVVSPAEGFFQPEILQDAKQGHIDAELKIDKARVLNLLGGQVRSTDPQQEAYRLLLVAFCNGLHATMPFLFQRINDYTELLLPDDLLSEKSVLHAVREALDTDSCRDVEVIGWLYQFYISEKKDEVFDGLKKNKKITPENIPAATQLFTPHWIVRYLVENSLGRLWLLNRPDSKLAERMDYYIKPEQAETDFLRIGTPEEIKVCDPACGSGHMLTYAFDLLYAIYEEEGVDPVEIPEKVLTYNLYGIEIDERAGELAAFALTMKARARQRRFFSKGVKPNICVLKNVRFDEGELKNYMDFVGRDLFTAPLQTTLHQFEEADNFGSLIRPAVTDVDGMLGILEAKNISGQIGLYPTHQKVRRVLQQADYLIPKYHVVIANPPYMGGKGMNGRLGAWAKDNYPNSKSDLFAMFIERNLDLAQKQGVVAMITMQSWMFLSSFESLRAIILNHATLLCLAHIGARGFDSIGGQVVSTTAFILKNSHIAVGCSSFLSLANGKSESEKDLMIREAAHGSCSGLLFHTSVSDFQKIPGKTFAYWISKRAVELFSSGRLLGDVSSPRQGLATSDDQRFLRYWHEVSMDSCALKFFANDNCIRNSRKWFPFVKGGALRRWFGNNDIVINWANDGAEVKEYAKSLYGSVTRTIKNIQYYFKEMIAWSLISGGMPSFRFQHRGQIFGHKGPGLFSSDNLQIEEAIALLNSKTTSYLLSFTSQNLSYEVGAIQKLPLPSKLPGTKSTRLIEIARTDWDSYENSWDFMSLPLFKHEFHRSALTATYKNIRGHWLEMTRAMQRLEEENNRIFIEAYGLQDELTPEVPLNEITLTCNPHYRYGTGKSEDELEALLLADTMRELVSYAVGCMFGRYALDNPGLILANQGETIEDYLKRVPEPSFPADDDNVIPMLDGDWFSDDIAERFRRFLRVAFGEESYEDNLQFIEQVLNSKGKRTYTIRDYFLGEFYNDHVRRYKKRPIYWLFSSPKGSFNALIYMHRYRPDTVSVVLNDYLREFRTKLNAIREHLEQVSISASAFGTEKTKALREIESIKKIIDELDSYENDILYPLATKKIEIDLDDGVKVNYPKFGAALKNVPGLS